MSSDKQAGSDELDENLRQELAGASGQSGPKLEFYGGKWMSALPIALFIAWAIFQSGLLGIGDTTGLAIGMLVSLTVGMLFVKGDWKDYANTIFEGMTRRVAATAIVAWLWAGMFAQALQDGGFVDGLVWAAQVLPVSETLLPQIFPAVTFILAALLATGIGTGYGTTIAFTGLFFPAGLLLGANPVLLFGAILSGAVFGDNLAPVSDTTIVSAVTQDSDIGGVVQSRFKYAIVAAVMAFTAYIVLGMSMPGIDIGQNAQQLLAEQSNPLGLVHLLSMGIVIVTAIRGRHIVEAISWGIITALIANLSLGLASVTDMLVFTAPEGAPFATQLAFLPFVETFAEGADVSAGVGGALVTGASGFFPLIVLTLLIVAGAQIMIRGGGFEALQNFLLSAVATNVRRAETTMVLGTASVNAMITINTAAEIAIAPYISRMGEKFNINGYRRANILDANTSALGYIFPWAGGVLVGVTQMEQLAANEGQFSWFTTDMVVNAIDVVPFVFHGWFLVGVFLLAALTGYGREYIPDRESKEVARV
ncbi:Na+/H+ antiporter NhaC family protein [Haladaptatus sp. DYSN1]|uniref:Na+/H+ antiporter NhaC family protein n=1 Tax=unclassified Haladaptatus TaxID=2622732 RepID=UPI0024057F90|nr:Na+/H+ antiporter NhaC family protein [Haladaptatus sp. DYSN1]